MTKEEILEKRRHIFGNALLAALSDAIMNMMDEWAGYLISNSSHVTTALEVPKHILDEYANQREQYWKERCLAAEDYISKSPCDPDITKEQIKAHEIWSQLVHNQSI